MAFSVFRGFFGILANLDSTFDIYSWDAIFGSEDAATLKLFILSNRSCGHVILGGVIIQDGDFVARKTDSGSAANAEL